MGIAEPGGCYDPEYVKLDEFGVSFNLMQAQIQTVQRAFYMYASYKVGLNKLVPQPFFSPI